MSGSLLGYRAMWSRLSQMHGLSVRRLEVACGFPYTYIHSTLLPRDTAMMMLSLMDPVGTASRKRRRLLRSKVGR